MSFVTTIDPALKIKPELLLQVLGEIKTEPQEMMTNVFKRKRTVPSDHVSRELVAQTIQAVPFSPQAGRGVAISGKSGTLDSITTPPFKAHQRLEAKAFKAAKNLKGKEYKAWLAEHVTFIKETITMNMEWFARHFLTTGNCSYKMLLDGAYGTNVYSLGTMPATGAPGTLFDAAGATLADVVVHLDAMREKGKAVAYRNYFRNPNAIVIYARTAVWNAIFNLLDGKTNNSVIGGKRIDIDTLQVGSYTIKKFDGDLVDPETQAAGNAIPAKKMRMIDTSAPATMVSLELENLKAIGGQKFVLINQVQDPGGEFVDIMVQWRPVGLFSPEAMVDSNAVIS
jgi:hypothetical protein